jgi:succinate-acetate transporter protein
MAQATETKAAVAVANPAPLGLFGFATTTLVLSAANAQLGGVGAVTAGGALGLALAYGGIAQFVAGMWEFKNGSTFGGAAFTSYGAFWISFWVLNNIGGSAPKGADDVGWYLLSWTIVTGLFFIGTLRQNWGLVVVFGLLFLTFLLLTIGAFNPPAAGSQPSPIGGYVGIATAIAAYYVGLAGILEHVSGGKISLPLGKIG